MEGSNMKKVKQLNSRQMKRKNGVSLKEILNITNDLKEIAKSQHMDEEKMDIIYKDIKEVAFKTIGGMKHENKVFQIKQSDMIKEIENMIKETDKTFKKEEKPTLKVTIK
jgi:hypothetical protein